MWTFAPRQALALFDAQRGCVAPGSARQAGPAAINRNIYTVTSPTLQSQRQFLRYTFLRQTYKQSIRVFCPAPETFGLTESTPTLPHTMENGGDHDLGGE